MPKKLREAIKAVLHYYSTARQKDSAQVLELAKCWQLYLEYGASYEKKLIEAIHALTYIYNGNGYEHDSVESDLMVSLVHAWVNYDFELRVARSESNV